MKALGAQIIALGIVMLAFGVVGLHLRLWWFLDALGPVMAYVFKSGVVLLGIWVWRKDGSAAVEEDVTEAESQRAWVPVAIAGVVIVGIITFMVVSGIKDSHLKKELALEPAPAEWASMHPNLWPDLTLMERAKFSHHSALEAGCACLVRLPTGEICALTAGHLLGQAGGVTPGFVRGGLGGLDKVKLATLDSEITSWKIYLPGEEKESAVNVVGLYGQAKQFDEDCDEVLLRLAPNTGDYPATPLDVRLSLVPSGETLYMMTYDWDDNGKAQQVVHKVHRVPGLGFTCMMDIPAELNGFSGAPIVDKNGLLVGILTGGSSLDRSPSGYTRAFTGHLASELLPVLKEAVAAKGTVALTPIKAVGKLPLKAETTTPAQALGNTI